MTLSPADIDRWDPEALRAVSVAAATRARSAARVSEALAQLPAMPVWSGVAARAAREAIDMTRLILDTHAEEARTVARASDKAAGDIEVLKSKLRNLDDDADAANVIIDRVTGTVLSNNGFRVDPAQFISEAELIQARLDEILAQADTIDTELAQAVSAAGIAFPIVQARAVPDPPESTKMWWDSLSRYAKDQILERNPEELGNRDGIPATDRSTANVKAMANDLRRIEYAVFEHDVSADEITAEPHRFGLNPADVIRYTNAVMVKQGLDSNQSQTGTEVLLLVYRPGAFGGQGRAAIAIGNPDNAGHIAVVVPGAGSSVANGWLARSDDAAHLYNETVAAAAEDRGVSVLAWMGYDAPDTIVDPRVAQTALARNGGAILAADINALNVTHHSPAHVTVVGHSYGSTTVADAAAGYGMHADDVVLVGSPGTDMARTASDFHLPDGGHVYVGSAASDPVTNLAGMPRRMPGTGMPFDQIGLGADPAADGFGSTRFKAEVPGWTWGPWTDHDDYFDNGSESLYSMADIASGQGAALQGHGMTAPHRDSLLGPLASRLDLPDWSVPLLDPELTRPATSGHYHRPLSGTGR